MTDTTLVLDQDIGHTTLAEEVARVGLPIIPHDQVRAHMRALVDKDCPRAFDRVMNIAANLSRFLTLRMLVKFFAPNMSAFNQSLIALLISALAIIGLVVLEGIYTGAGLAALMIGFGWVSQILSITTAHSVYGYARERVVWETHTITSYLADGEVIPNRLKKRADIGGNVGNVKVLAEKVDPFLIVERGFLFWKERVVIGAWNTSTPMDDM